MPKIEFDRWQLEDRQFISEHTAFDQGDEFKSEDQVRAYFTVENIAEFYDDGVCPFAQDELDIMAEAVIANRWHMVPLTWQVIEDNGGGLHLAVFDGERVIFYGHGYEHNEDGLRADLEALRNGADPRTDAWETPVDDPQVAYDDLTRHEYGWQVVADQDGVYYDRMGAAAQRVFGTGE